jgi:hypothetical protein
MNETDIRQNELVRALRKAGHPVEASTVNGWVNVERPSLPGGGRRQVEEIEKILRGRGAQIRNGLLVELYLAAKDRTPPKAIPSPQAPDPMPLPTPLNVPPSTPLWRSRWFGRTLWAGGALLVGTLLVVALLAVWFFQPDDDNTSPERLTPSGVTKKIYEVSSGDGSYSRPIDPQGKIEQRFRVTTSQIQRVSVVVGRDGSLYPPDIPNGEPIGAIRVQLLDLKGNVLLDEREQARNNVTTTVSASSPITVETGSIYILIVTNEAEGPLGFYFGRRDNTPIESTTVQGGHAKDQEGPTPDGLSGSIEG